MSELKGKCMMCNRHIFDDLRIWRQWVLKEDYWNIQVLRREQGHIPSLINFVNFFSVFREKNIGQLIG